MDYSWQGSIHPQLLVLGWASFLARDKTLQEKCYLEQKTVCGENLPPLTYDQLKDLNLLDRCIKETLRLRPPIMIMMRMARTPQTVAGYTIPPGHQVCVSPTVNQRLKDSWVERLDFNPDRYLQDNPASGKSLPMCRLELGVIVVLGKILPMFKLRQFGPLCFVYMNLISLMDTFPP